MRFRAPSRSARRSSGDHACSWAIHALPVPPASGRPPLRDHVDPVGETLHEIGIQAAHLNAADLSTQARRAIDEELAWAAEFQLGSGNPPITLISFDAHPGNFLILPSGTAVLVDLEKARYGAAGFRSCPCDALHLHHLGHRA